MKRARKSGHWSMREASCRVACGVSLACVVGCQGTTEREAVVGQVEEDMSRAEQEMGDASHGAPDMMVGGEVMSPERVSSQDVPLEERVAWCRPGGVKVEGVGADGTLWGVEASSGEVVMWRPEEGAADLFEPGVSITRLRAWSESAVAIASNDRLFTWRRERREGPALHELRAPFEGAMIQALCGDPGLDGSFVVAGGLYERAGGQWWRLKGPEEAFDHASLRLADVAGECSGRDGWLWAFDERGVYQIDQDESIRHEPAEQLAIDPSLGVMARRGERLEAWRPAQGSWREIVFDAGPVRQLVGTAGHVWVVAGETLFHEGWRGRVRVALEGVELSGVRELHADPVGGAWLVLEDQLCRVEPEVSPAVSGLRPYQRTTQATHRLLLEVPSRVTLDEEVVHEGDGEVTLTFAAQGWHTVEVEVLATQHRQVFDIWRQVERVPNWEEDIAPIAVTSCGAGACHGGAQSLPGQPRLLTYEEWVRHASAIENRVGRVGDMPPAGASQGWMASDATTVLAWLRGGMKQRSEESDD